MQLCRADGACRTVSADIIGPLANSLDARNPLAMHRNAGTLLATSGSFASDRRHDCMHLKAYIANCLSHGIENIRDPILFVDVHE
jgi:hypothetical protein